MKKKKLFQYLKTLSKKEWKEFDNLIKSPYFNVPEKCQNLFEYIKNQHDNNIKIESIPEINIIENVFDGKINTSYYTKIRNDLTKLLERFFMLQQLDKESIYKGHFLRKNLIERELPDYYEQEKKKANKDKNKLKKGRDCSLFQYLFSIEELKKREREKSSTISLTPYKNIIRDLDEYYLANRLFLMNNFLSVQSQQEINEEIPFVKEILDIAISEMYANHPLLKAHSLAFKCLKNKKNDIIFSKFEQHINQNYNNFDKTELHDFLTIIVNHYIRLSNNSEHLERIKYSNKIFEGYKKMDYLDVLLSDQLINERKFKNIVHLGCQFGEFEWTKDFIERYENKLPNKIQDGIKHFVKASYFFHQKGKKNRKTNLKKALIEITNYIQLIQKANLRFKANAHSLLLRIYYELEQYEAIEKFIPSFENFINNKLQTEHQESYKFLISNLKKLTIKKGVYMDKQDKKNFKNSFELDAMPNDSHKKWLEEKIKKF